MAPAEPRPRAGQTAGSAASPRRGTPEQPKQAERTGAKPARGYPGSFDQPEPRPEVMRREGGPHPEPTAEVPPGMGGYPEPPGSRGHDSPPVRHKPGRIKGELEP